MKACVLTLSVCLFANASQFDVAAGSIGHNGRGIALQAEGKFKQAESEYRAALKLQSKIANGQEAYAAMRNNLGAALEAQGRLDEATAEYKAALSLQEEVFGEDNEVLAPALNNLAMIWRRRAEPRRSIPLLERALAIQIKRLGPDNLRVATTLHNFGLVHYDLRRTGSAQKFFKQALELFERYEDKASAGATLSFLGRMAADRRDYGEAVALAQKAYSIRLAVFGPKHRNVGIALSDLAELHTEQQHFDRAADLLHQAISILDADQGIDQHLTMALYRLGDAYRLSGQYDAALDRFARAEKLIEQAQGPQHASLVPVLDRHADVLRKLRRKDEAGIVADRANRIHAERMPTDFARYTVDLGTLLNSR